MIDEKREEAAQKEAKRKAALKAKIDRQVKDREEKERVDRLIRKNKKIEETNAAILAQAAARKTTDAEIQRMKEILRQLTMEEEEVMEVEVPDQEVVIGANPSKPSNINNKRRKSRASPPKPTSAATSTSNTNINAAKESFFNQRNAFQSLQDTQRVAPIEYQQECGLHCASRGPHSHAQDVNNSENPHQNPTTAPLNPNQHHQRRKRPC